MQPKQIQPSSVSPLTGRRYGAVLCFSLLLGLPATLRAAPHIPGSESEVLEVLPTQLRGNNDPISRLRAQWRANPQDVTTVAALSRLYIETGREQSDPRYYGYAAALLQPWWQQTDPPDELLLLRATIRQHNHEYVAATQDLEHLVKRNPAQTQAWLTLATVQLVNKEYAAARRSCSALATHASTWFATLCYSQVMSQNGEAERAYPLQITLLPSLGKEQVELRQWVLTLLGETAARIGKVPEADQHFQAALAEPRRDNYLLRVYSDFLISQQRPLDVITLLQDKTSDDALLLRLAIASRDARQPTETARYQALLEARYQAAKLRGSTLHAEDEALYARTFGAATS